MITLADRRDARRFADLVDNPDADGTDVAATGELAPLLLLSRTIQRVPVNGDIDPEFRAKLRARVVAMSAVRVPAQRQASETIAPPAPARAPRSGRRLVIAGGAMACALSLGGVGVASSHAVVGDRLYGIKRATESTQLKLAGSDASKGRRYLTLARTRLGEAREVRGEQAAVIETLAAMDLSTRRGTRLLTGVAASEQDRAPLDSIDEFAAVQRTDLASLISKMPAGPGRERAVESLVLVERLQARSIALRATLVCPVAAASADDLGPRPAYCGNAPGAAAPGAGPLGPGANGLPGLAPSGAGGTPLPGAAAGSAGAGVTAPPVPPTGSGAAGAVSGIVDDVLGGLGGNAGAPAATSPPTPPLGLPLPSGLPLPLPLPSIVPTLPPLLP